MLLHFQAEIKHIIWQTCFTCPQCHSDWSPRGHLPGCFNAPHFLLTRVPFSTPFPNSLAYKQIAACLLICVLSAAFEKFCSNKQGTVTGTSWIFQTYLLPGSMKVPHFCINTGNGISLSCVFLVGCHRSDSDLAIQFVDWCKWLVYLASYWLGWIFRKPCHGAFCRLTWKNLFVPAKKTPTTTAPNSLWCCSNEGRSFFHSRKNNSRCLINMFKSKSSTQFDNQSSHECPFKHAAAGVICQGASMLPTSFVHGGSFQLEWCTTQRVVSVGRYQTPRSQLLSFKKK